MNILHITDLHLDHFEGDVEFIRNGFYREYIDRLFASLEKKINPIEINYLIVTGDLINIGKIENYENVEIILNYISSKFSINKKNICLTIGNHDYKWKELKIQDIEKEKLLKLPFKEFRDKYNSTYVEEVDYFFLTKLDNNTYFLSIDSTWNSQEGAPGEFSVSEEDRLVTLLNDSIENNATLLIGCHFPIISLDNNFLAGEDTDWHNNHIWIKGNSLRDRIKRVKTINTIWFHGDVHASDQKIIDNEIFVLTSKFGGKPDTSAQRRQAVLISINETHISKITCNYEFPAHEQNPRLGDWICSDIQELRKSTPVEQHKLPNTDKLSAYNEEVEKEILRLVKGRELYKFGRFHISDEYISLGWVDINKLMSDKELLNRISDKCYELIRSKITNSNADTLFLGIEIIGGVLASQLSVRLNIKNSIIPVRSKSDHYSEFEFSHSSAFENIINIKDVVIFIDIISTGNTINSLVADIISKNADINIHVISIISNDIENKLISIPNTKSYTTFCTSLKIPLIKHSEMPEEEYVKTNLKF